VRILHTADLHLGKLLHGHSLLEDQRHVLDQITQAVVGQSPDVLIVAGDIFDRSIPPVGAVQLFGSWLSEVRRRAPAVPIVIISGNHDNGSRLSWASALLDPMIHLRGDPEDTRRPVHFTTQGGEAVEIWAVPFLWPGALPAPEGEPASQEGAFRTAMSMIAELRDEARTQVLVAHCFAYGGSETDSERRLVGQATLIDPALFDPFDYAALGHLHRPQPAGRQGYYSGSPLAYSFSETSAQKCVLVVETVRGQRPDIQRIKLEPLRPVKVVETTLDDLLEQGQHDHLRDVYLSVHLTERTVHRDPMQRIRARFPFALELRTPRVELGEDAQLRVASRTGRVDLGSDFEAFWLQVEGLDAPAPVKAAFALLRPHEGGLQ
jgi:exonuclease SbcD